MASQTSPILHLFIGSVPGGVLRYIVDLAGASESGPMRPVLAGQRGDWHSLVEQQRLEWVEIPIRGGILDLWRSSRTIANLVRQRGVRLIHAHHRRATLVGRMVQRRLAWGEEAQGKAESRKPKAEIGRREVSDFESKIENRKSKIPLLGIPLLYTLHLTDMPMGFPWRWLSDFGDHCHAPSIAAKRWLMEVGRVPEQRITVIPHGVRAERWPIVDAESRAAARSRFGLPAGGQGQVAAFVGRLEDPKNEAWVVELAAECRRRALDVHFLLAGDGPNRPAVERQIAGLDLQDRVKLLGECDPVSVYHASDLMVMPSSREGFSYACAEAMCCGVPVLRTRTAGTEEMIVEGVTGRSCAIEKRAFIEAGLNMLSHSDLTSSLHLLSTMGTAAAEHVRKELTFDRQVAQTMALYDRLARRNAGDRAKS